MGLFSKKKNPTIPPEALLPWVHRRSHLELLHGLAIRSGREPLQLRPLCDSFAFTIALGTTEGPVPVKEQHLEALGLDADQALKQAVQNVVADLRYPAAADGVLVFKTKDEIAGCGLIL